MAWHDEDAPLKGARLEGGILVGELRVSTPLGDVYDAEHTETGESLVVKTPHPALLGVEGFAESLESVLERLVEVEHPAVARVTGHGRHEQQLYYTADLPVGESLGRLAQAAGAGPTLGTLVGWVGTLASGLDHLHHQGFVHSTVTPWWITITEEEEARLSDFALGSALAALEPRAVLPWVSAVPAPYRAPECARGQRVSPSVDVYGLARTACYAVLRREPPSAPAEVTAALEPLAPPEAVDVLLKASAADPIQRYTSGFAFAEALQAAVDVAEATPDARPPREPSRRPRSPARPAKRARTPRPAKDRGARRRRERVGWGITGANGLAFVLLLCVTGAITAWRVAASADTPADAVQTIGETELQVLPSWARVTTRQMRLAERLGVSVAFTHDLGMRYVLVPGGAGAESGRGAGRAGSSSPFYLQITEVTEDQVAAWPGRPLVQGDAFLRQRSPEGKYDEMPVKTWEQYTVPEWEATPDQRVLTPIDAATVAEFVAWLNGRNPSRPCRLPTSVEWERACRAGTSTTWYWGEDEDKAYRYENWGGWNPRPRPPARDRPNGWGIYDLLGNVAELCRTAPANRAAPATYVIRGGSFLMPGVEPTEPGREVAPEEERTPFVAVGFRTVIDVAHLRGE